ncbi:MAG TPA: bifunctional phosphoribosyl-AMP cyclohydrolase/phosphoribosyl-ATP diphosphatase HisIE [Candidatus Limnocylindrales bacterium]|nr:bifunctional phosphoribosyl-AMP cyclohydrolase/phosphoribosyl-ATP diphosphatase HisIE [Candidatus Limnocylindrales bacterium]
MTAPAAPRRTAPLWGPNGLAPAIVQDARDGRVLMLGWMDDEAWRVTQDTGKVHFHSRTRDRLWRKGESSGHELVVRDIALDCDADAILVSVDPIGPTCHRDTRSCFDEPDARIDRPPQGFAWLEELWATIADRAASRPDGSYTTALLEAGVDGVGRKVTEEATEVLIAARDDAEAERHGADRTATAEALAGETADLLYHALVLLAERGMSPAGAIDVLRDRHAR